jgi:TRAP-type mannitol/chloroaromatic compound transport system substrate-binding protein
MNSWFYGGGAIDLWREVYEPFNVVPFPGGNTGVQMGGWFNKEINSSADLKGLKMRIPGLGADVLTKAGGNAVLVAGGEIYTNLDRGVIDATEWVGPYHDLKLGFYKAAKYYYYPGFHEPGTTLEAIINKKALQTLPKDLQSIVLNACRVVNQDLLSEYTARNPAALDTLLNKHKVDMRIYPEDVLKQLRKISEEVVSELANKDAFTKKTYASYSKFYNQAKRWSDISQLAFLQARDMT